MSMTDCYVAPVEWKVDESSGELQGYASTFGNVDLDDDIIVKGAFKKTISERVRAGQVRILADHMPRTSNVLGTMKTASEDSHGLKFTAELSSAPSVQDTRIKMLEGHLDRLSIGYEPIQWSFEEKEGKSLRILSEIKLWEVSVVVFPANPEAAITRVKEDVEELMRKYIARIPSKRVRTELSEKVDNFVELAEKAISVVDDKETVSDDKKDADHQIDDDAADGVPSDSDHQDDSAAERKSKLTALMAGADSLLAGRDPNETADPLTVARVTARLEVMNSQFEKLNELADRRAS